MILRGVETMIEEGAKSGYCGCRVLWPSCPNEPSPHVKRDPSAARAIECAMPALADTMRTPLQASRKGH